MGYGTTRTQERVAAAMGLLASAPPQFQAACDVPKGGVLLALPALLTTPEDVPSFSAASFTLSYSIAVLFALVLGVLASSSCRLVGALCPDYESAIRTSIVRWCRGIRRICRGCRVSWSISSRR